MLLFYSIIDRMLQHLLNSIFTSIIQAICMHSSVKQRTAIYLFNFRRTLHEQHFQSNLESLHPNLDSGG